MKNTRTAYRWLVGVCALFALAGCEQLRMKPTLFSQTMSPSSTTENDVSGPPAAPPPVSNRALGEAPIAPPPADIYSPGTERFVRSGTRSGAGTRSDTPSEAPEGEVTLNFEATNILEVVKVILGDLLQLNYRVGPGVQGTVTLQTSHPIPRDALLPTLEMLLRANGAALVKDTGIFHVVQRENALRGLVSPQLGDSRQRIPSGYSVRIVPLAFIAAQEMHKILEPFAGVGGIVRVDSPRNLLVLAGAAPELERLIETVRAFDVDWMAGMSVGLFTPDFVDATTLSGELRTILDDDGKGPLAGLVRIVELERLNALLVITSRKVYLQRVATWIERLDKDPGGLGQRLFVYHVQNGRAVDLAAVLSQVFENDETREKAPAVELAPGLTPVTVGDAPSATVDATPPATAAGGTPPVPVVPMPTSSPRQSTRAGEGLTLAPSPSLRIIPDEVNNALLVKATTQEYKLVQAALRQLDIVPLQVLVEATIAEITLTDELEYGLQWFFKNSHRNGKTGNVTLDVAPAGIGAIAPGFSYALTDAAGMVRAVLNTLAAESRVNILSSPSLMVLNNQTATINVGDEVPVTTQQQQATAGTSTIVNNIEFRDTGVLLTVTPRVNAGGLVTMEIEQEVSNVAAGTGNSLTPTIQQRKITSTVAVKSGDTVVLGGLIRENTSLTQSGLPILHKLPLIGPLFGATNQEQRRTELVVLITPRAVQDRESAQRITDEFKSKMHSLQPLPKPKVPKAGGADNTTRSELKNSLEAPKKVRE
jgi:general secretion pathway protein D